MEIINSAKMHNLWRIFVLLCGISGVTSLWDFNNGMIFSSLYYTLHLTGFSSVVILYCKTLVSL